MDKVKDFFRDFFKSNLYLIYGFIFLLYVYFIITSQGMAFDMSCWKNWTIFSFENGLNNIYTYEANDYLPLYHYLLSLFGQSMGNAENIANHINGIRIVTLGFEFVTGFVLLKLFYDKFSNNISKAIACSMFYFANFAIFYNSVVWGQIDGILTCFVFLAFIFAYRKQVLFSLIFIILSINLKPQAIVFLPLLFLMLLPEVYKFFSVKKLLVWIVIPLLLQLIILIPFYGSWDKIWQIATGYVGKYPCISINAYNFWALLIGDYCYMPDTTKFVGITYRNWGLLLFFITGFFALFPLLQKNCKIIFKKDTTDFSLKTLLIGATLVALLFFFFNTQMHERYAYPALVFCIAYGVLYKRPLSMILLSLAFFINMEYAMFRSMTSNHVALVRAICAILYFVDILLLFKDLYNIKFKRFLNIFKR